MSRNFCFSATFHTWCLVALLCLATTPSALAQCDSPAPTNSCTQNSGPASCDPAVSGAHICGQWSSPKDIGVSGVNAVLLKTGKVLLYYKPTTTNGTSRAKVYDPSADTFVDVSPTFNGDILCS